MKEAADHAGEGLRAARDRAEAGAAIYEPGRLTDKPPIAAVRGYALGGGCNLAIACNLAVAGASAGFGYPEVRRGLAATMVAPGLAHRVGPKTAFELLTLAENVSANRPLELGMINRIVPDEQVLDEALAMAEALAAFDREACARPSGCSCIPSTFRSGRRCPRRAKPCLPCAGRWCRRSELNTRPHPYQGCALPLSYGGPPGASMPQGTPGGQADMAASEYRETKEEKQRRLAEALRRNLRRRKARQRGESGESTETPDSVAERDC